MQVNDPQLNVEYFFRLLYECFHGGPLCQTDIAFSSLATLAAQIWVWITAIGYVLAVIGLLVITYTLVRLYELRQREHKELTTLIKSDYKELENERWEHIGELVKKGTPSDLRQAIIEADIMLDGVLTEEGFHGEGVGEKLKQVTKEDLPSIQDAWEAHKVRNQIAHSGSSFDLSPTLANRTLARYETVFRDFGSI